MADWTKIVAALGRPDFQKIAEPPAAAPETPGAMAARWMAELEGDLVAGRVSRAVYEQRRQAVIDWLAQA